MNLTRTKFVHILNIAGHTMCLRWLIIWFNTMIDNNTHPSSPMYLTWKKTLVKTVLINNSYDIVITARASYANDTNIKRAILLYTYILGLCNLLRLRTRGPPLARASHTLYYTMTRIREWLHLHGLFKIYFIAKDLFFSPIVCIFFFFFGYNAIFGTTQTFTFTM